MTKEILGLSGWTPTPLYRRTYKAVHEIDQKLTNLIHKWHHLKTGLPMKVDKHDGTQIYYQGIAFKGSPVDVFWGGFIEPYLESYSIIVLEQTSSLAVECQFPVSASVEEAKSLLLVMVRRVYSEMAETDRILRGDGINFPEKRDVTGKIESMSHAICEHAEIEKMKKPLSGDQIFNIENVNGTNIQFGNNNHINNISIQQFIEKIAISEDEEAKSMLKNLLRNNTALGIIGTDISSILSIL
ncbi:hypothetical protein [Yersinia proxima]|uniref:hypothetical protein n=1 Tax=Yersinia proxima TaxID=2890316 RepID=UPI0037D72B17